MPDVVHSIPDVVRVLAAELAEHRVIPFVGAGLSAQQLHVDWDALSLRMLERLGAAHDADNVEVATDFTKVFGRAELVDLLREYLDADSFDATVSGAHLALMCLGTGTVYTTNQDNLIELCHERFGRPLQKVIGLPELATLKPADSVVYKFHGDLSAPDSIVFTADDFGRRGVDSHHPLDVRLRSDVLGKSLLFLGYSFRDPNMRKLFQHLDSLFRGKIPAQYLVQYFPDPAGAAELKANFNIEAIDCTTLYPGADEAEAFDRFLSDLCREVVACKADRELSEFFRPPVPATNKVVTSYDVAAVEHAFSSGGYDTAYNAFRGTCDRAVIASEFSERVSILFAELCRRAAEPDHASKVAGALHNLRVPDAGHMFDCWASAMAVANVLPRSRGTFHTFLPHVEGIPDELRLIGVALAIMTIEDEWGRELTQGFYDWVPFATVQCNLDAIPPEALKAVAPVFARAYQRGRTTYENPISYHRRASGRGGAALLGPLPTAGTLRDGMLNMLPKRLFTPYRTS